MRCVTWLLSTRHWPHLLLSAVLRRRCCYAPTPAVDRYLLPVWRSPANPPHVAAAVDRWDRRTDAYAAGGVKAAATLVCVDNVQRGGGALSQSTAAAAAVRQARPSPAAAAERRRLPACAASTCHDVSGRGRRRLGARRVQQDQPDRQLLAAVHVAGRHPLALLEHRRHRVVQTHPR